MKNCVMRMFSKVLIANQGKGDTYLQPEFDDCVNFNPVKVRINRFNSVIFNQKRIGFMVGILDFERFRSLVDLSRPCHFKLNRN